MSKVFRIIVLLICVSPVFSAELPQGFVKQVILENIDPVGMSILDDGRILIAEKNGTIKLVHEGKLQHHPFLKLEVDNFNERGLQSIVPDPDFDHNAYIYVFYTHLAGFNRVSRFIVNGNYALPESEVPILDMDPLEAAIHNGGALAFGVDGKLYISTGDTGNPGYSANLTNLHGKILRLNKDGSIPEDNPYYGELSGKNKAIYAYGFRNPFSMAVSKTNGLIFSNDVGQDTYEEVNLILPAKDYGWPEIEGYKASGRAAPENYMDPFYAYTHAAGRCAIVGAAFYEPTLKTFPPQYWNKYFFGDYCSGEIFYLDPHTGEVEGTLATGVNRLVSIMANDEGDLFYLQRAGMGDGSVGDNTSSNNGSLIMIRFTGSGAPFISRQPQSVTAPVGEDATFTVFASGEQPLRYEWLLNGQPVGGDSSKLVLKEVTLDLNGAQVSCTITNNEGSVISDFAILRVVNNQRPTPFITLPNESIMYKGGDILYFAGTAHDAEDGELDGSALSWKIDLHHESHTHPALEGYTGSQGQYTIPQIGETSPNVWYRIYLTATDSEGLTNTTFVEVYPYKIAVTVNTVPANLQLKLDGKSFQKDTVFTSVSGLIRSLQADQLVAKDGKLYQFESWNVDQLNSIFTFTVPLSDTLITAHFTEISAGTGDGLNTYFYSSDQKFREHLPDLVTKGNIDYDWGLGSPEGIPADYFYARFIGFIAPYFSGEHVFYTNSDDGVRLWVNEQLVIDDWNLHPSGQYIRGSIDLEKDRKYSIKLEYLEATGFASVQLLWSFANLPRHVIPLAQLYATDSSDEGEGEEEGEGEGEGEGAPDNTDPGEEEPEVGEPTGLKPVSEGGLWVYPNPFTGGFIIEVPAGVNWQQMEILNSDGRRVHTIKKGDSNRFYVSSEAFPAGLYILKWVTDKTVYQTKLIKKN